MIERCDQLDDYVDSELAPGERAAFELHLATCEACAADLPRLLALVSALEAAAHATSGAPRLAAVPNATAAAPHAPPAAAPARPQRRARWVAASALAAAAAAAVVVLVARPPARPTPPVVASLADQLGPTRHLEARLSYAGAERYRPLDVARGATSSEAISIDRMGQLEHARDWHGVAVAALLAGERERAARFFAQAAATPEVDSDRAALELLDGSQDALQRALDDVDRALQAAPNNPAALWNRALVLAGLDLPLAAARELDHVIALGEPGWADEARRRAAALRGDVMQRWTRWKQANDAGTRLIEDGTPVPAELLTVIGYMTIMLYDAVRSAPSRERVEALLPMAQALDATYRANHLSRYVRSVAASDFRVRRPLAETYRELILHGPLPDRTVQRFLEQLERTHTDDIWMGAVVRTGRIAANLDTYRSRAAATQDPWFAAIAEHETANAEIARGKVAAADRRLREASALARRERLTYRALAIDNTLGSLHDSQHRLSQAAAEKQAGYREAAAEGEWTWEINTLTRLAAINQDRYAHGLARGYLREIIERSKTGAMPGGGLHREKYDCARLQYAYDSLASISLAFADPDRARAELAEAPRCGDQLTSHSEQVLERGLTLQHALVWTELHRFSRREEDARIAWDSLAALRAGQDRAEQAFRAYIEGNLLIDVDAPAGERALRDAIAKAGDRTDDYSLKARVYSFSLLALNAGRAARFNEVIDLLAHTLAVPKPERCAVAIATQDDRTVVAFVDGDGDTGGRYTTQTKPADLDIAALVPASAVARLRACDRVAVLARAPVLGRGRLLPPDLAWSYLLAGARPPATPPITGARHLIIANPVTAPDLKFPPLNPYLDDPRDGNATVLRGGDATPTRILQAMRGASMIEFHTHGFIANDVSESSYLVLAPEPDRQYAVTASDVAGIKLEAAPLVILGACHSALSSSSLEGGMGLAEAFLRSGAHAVIASPDAVQDLGAFEWFRAVRERVMHGAPAAAAVRDERLKRLATSRDDPWVSGIVVFE